MKITKLIVLLDFQNVEELNKKLSQISGSLELILETCIVNAYNNKVTINASTISVSILFSIVHQSRKT